MFDIIYPYAVSNPTKNKSVKHCCYKQHVSIKCKKFNKRTSHILSCRMEYHYCCAFMLYYGYVISQLLFYYTILELHDKSQAIDRLLAAIYYIKRKKAVAYNINKKCCYYFEWLTQLIISLL